MAAEGEHGQGDECFWGSESERDPGEQADFGVGRFDQPLGQPVFEGGVDGGAVFDDLAVLTVAVDADDVVTGFADGFGGVGQDGDGVVVTVTW